jgi:hypothetical protein
VSTVKWLTHLNHVYSARHQNLHFITMLNDVEVQGDPKPLLCRLNRPQEREELILKRTLI